MTRLAEAGVVTLVWTEDADGIAAEGHQSYEIDADNEIAVFQGQKCVEIKQAVDLPHAISMVLASEAVCSRNIRDGADFRGRKVNEHGWRVS